MTLSYGRGTGGLSLNGKNTYVPGILGFQSCCHILFGPGLSCPQTLKREVWTLRVLDQLELENIVALSLPPSCAIWHAFKVTSLDAACHKLCVQLLTLSSRDGNCYQEG